MSEYGNGYDSNNMMGSTNFNDLINSYDYKSSRNKIFKPQNQEFRWKELMRLNPEYIRKTNDGSYKNFVTDRAGFGIAFWTYHQRKRALLAMCKGKIGDLHCQLNFLVKEIHGQKKLYSILTTTKDVNTACDRVLIDFENGKNYKKKINERRSFCRRFL